MSNFWDFGDFEGILRDLWSISSTQWNLPFSLTSTTSEPTQDFDGETRVYIIDDQAIHQINSILTAQLDWIPVGMDMWCPPSFLSSLNRLFLNLPLRFLGVGAAAAAARSCWIIIILSSLSSKSISLSASSCSRFFKCSSWIFCCSMAWRSSSSRHRNSFKSTKINLSKSSK